MFKYDDYPEIKKAHRVSCNWNKKLYDAEFAHERRGVETRTKKWQTLIDSGKSFDENVYSQVVFNVFNPIKPILTKVKTGENIAWDEIFEQKEFEELDSTQRQILFMLVEYERPYRLPEKYYDKRDRIEEKLKGTY